MMKFNLIIPVASDKPEYESTMPYVFSLGQDGYPLCLKAIQGLNLSIFNNIYYVILEKHNKLYRIEDLLKIHFERMHITNKTQVIILENQTKSQPETVMQAIEKAHIDGAMMVKDADSYFSCKVVPENSVCIYPLDKMNWVNPQDKSYLSIDEGYFITNIIEKRIIGRHFCAGGYIFANIDDFKTEYEKNLSQTPLYMSHIIFSMLLGRSNFRPEKCCDYQDWGTREDWMKYKI